ncbi:MAG: ABC-F type ribosomal protection protein [Erysipelotrichaceae bacterium]|jgi:ATP-binding cassette subfamily F protein 3|nr:ABC-F type ribosomal protection protein [Erysipelotrichaceae bacterium]
MLYQIAKGTKAFGPQQVFANINFQIKGSEKIAVIGRNGSGKTTLLKIIAGLEDLSSGQIFANNQIRIGYLSQTALPDDSLTVHEALLEAYAQLLLLQKKLEDLAKAMEQDFSEKIQNDYSITQSRFEAEGGYSMDTELLTVFTKFGFKPEDLQRPIHTFSGGQRTKIAFVRLLLSKPDILLLDEPTNHLDLSTIEWLEGYLKNYPKAIVLVSHDRMFLDRVASHVAELELGNMTFYTGNYSSYLAQKQQMLEANETAYKNQQLEIERLEKLIEKFRYKKSKAAFAQSKIKYLDRMERVELIRNDNTTLKMTFAPRIRGAKVVLKLDDYQVGYDKPLLSLSYELLRGQKVAVIGDNGTGKSTLVKSIVDKIPALCGEKLLGHQIEIGYFDQQLAQFDSDKTVLEELWNLYPSLDRTQIRTVLGCFLFRGDDVFKEVSVLSGGERVRLYLARLMLQKANFLILDEPTNHLDMPGKEALENALSNYQGSLLLVSHDRYFINKTCSRLIFLRQDTVEFFEGNYQQWLERNQPAPKEIVKEKKEPKKPAQPKKPDPKKALLKLEQKIYEQEQRQQELEELLELPEYYEDFLKCREVEEEMDTVRDNLKRCYRELEELLALE